MCDRLADLRHDRYDGHAGGKSEGKDQSHEYLFHLLISPTKRLSKRHHVEHPDLALKEEYLVLRGLPWPPG